jgi:hypothetical protein
MGEAFVVALARSAVTASLRVAHDRFLTTRLVDQTMPTTSPDLLINGPPEFPTLTDNSTSSPGRDVLFFK